MSKGLERKKKRLDFLADLFKTVGLDNLSEEVRYLIQEDESVENFYKALAKWFF